MREAAAILEMGQRLAFAVLRTLAGLVGLGLGALSRAGRKPRHVRRPVAPVIDDELEPFTLNDLPDLTPDTTGWPQPPAPARPIVPTTLEAYRRGRR